MAVTIKSPREIELMREAGRILAITHNELEKALKPGMSTLDIDRLGEEIIRSYGCIPSLSLIHILRCAALCILTLSSQSQERRVQNCVRSSFAIRCASPPFFSASWW